MWEEDISASAEGAGLEEDHTARRRSVTAQGLESRLKADFLGKGRAASKSNSASRPDNAAAQHLNATRDMGVTGKPVSHRQLPSIKSVEAARWRG